MTDAPDRPTAGHLARAQERSGLILPPAIRDSIVAPSAGDTIARPRTPELSPDIVACTECGCVVAVQLTQQHDRVCPGRAR